MENDNVKYGILLSKDQLAVLGKKRGYNRMNLYKVLCENTAMTPYDTNIRGVKVHVGMGECLYPNTKLEEDLGINRKTVQDVIHELNMVGIIKTETGNRCSVHNNQALAFWIQEETGKTLQNPHYSRKPKCQPTKGLKPKKEKNPVSTNDDVQGKDEDRIRPSCESTTKNEKVANSSADTSTVNTQAVVLGCPSEIDNNPSQSSEPALSADQNSASTKESNYLDKPLISKEKKENANEVLYTTVKAKDVYDDKQIQEEKKLYGQLYEAYKPYLTDDYYVDPNKDVYRIADFSLVISHDEIAREFFSKAKNKH